MFKVPFPIPLQVHPFYPLVAFFLGFLWSGGNLSLSLFLMGVITLSLLVHEMGHALAGLMFSQKVTISLLPFGGLTERKGKPLRAWQDFIVVLMGPLFGLGLYFLALYLKGKGQEGLRVELLMYTAYINLMWTVLNLIPVIPLDGGQLLRIVMQGIWGVGGLRWACMLSTMIGALITAFFVLNQDFFIGTIFAIFSYESWTLYSSVRYLRSQDIEVAPQRLIAKGERAYQKGDLEKASEIFSEIRRSGSGGALYNLSTLRLADMALKDKRFEEGYQLLLPIKKELNLDGLMLLQELAFSSEHWEEALFAGSEVAKHHPSLELSLQNAKAAIKLNLHEAAQGWAASYKSLGGDPTSLEGFH